MRKCLFADDTWQKQPDAPQREAYQQAEIRIALAKDNSEVMTPIQIAEAVVDQIHSSRLLSLSNKMKTCVGRRVCT